MIIRKNHQNSKFGSKFPKSQLSTYKVWMLPAVHPARKRLPGKVRQRIKRVLTNLGRKARPAESEKLTFPDTVDDSIKAEWELRRYRLDDWRVVYAINETWQEVAILAIRKRPPYDYEDLAFLLSHLWQ